MTSGLLPPVPVGDALALKEGLSLESAVVTLRKLDGRDKATKVKERRTPRVGVLKARLVAVTTGRAASAPICVRVHRSLVSLPDSSQFVHRLALASLQKLEGFKRQTPARHGQRLTSASCGWRASTLHSALRSTDDAVRRPLLLVVVRND